MVDDIYIPRSWSTPAANFDTFAKACMTLLKCLTLKWVRVTLEINSGDMSISEHASTVR